MDNDSESWENFMASEGQALADAVRRDRRITAEHYREPAEVRRWGSAAAIRVDPGVSLSVTYREGDETTAVAALDRAYADVKQQITGMVAVVGGTAAEDERQ